MSAPSQHARFAARSAHVRGRARRRRLSALIAVVVVLGGAVAAWFSPALAIRSVQVVGASGDLSAEVRQVADLERGVPAPRVDVASVERRLNALPGVAGAHVAREFPLDLKVTVTPRQPVLIATVPRESSRLIDREGVAYAVAGDGPRPAVPVVPLRDGSQLRSPGLGELAEVMAALPTDERSRVRDVRLNATGRIAFTLGGLEVRWGLPGESARKAQALRTLRPIAADRHATAVDLSSPDRPVLVGP